MIRGMMNSSFIRDKLHALNRQISGLSAETVLTFSSFD